MYAEYKRTGCVPVLLKCGRKEKQVGDKEKSIILQEFESSGEGSLSLEMLIRKKHKIHVPHNRIYKVLLVHGKIVENSKKKKRRKWVRYEREHPLSLVHMDWSEFENTHVVACLDDASRMVLSCFECSRQNTKNTIMCLEKAMEFAYGYKKIDELLTDHGAEFTVNKPNKKGKIKLENHVFEDYLIKHGIKHVLARVNHPQTNGKIERFFQTYKKHRKRYKSVNEFLEWYNNKRPHMSLRFNKAETPSEAFIRKMPVEVWLSKTKHWF